MNNEAIIKMLTRNGYYSITHPHDFNLGMFDAINNSSFPFDIILEANKYADGDWVIVCPTILEERHNCFWHGQDCSNEIVVSDPTKHVLDWQNRRNTT